MDPCHLCVVCLCNICACSSCLHVCLILPCHLVAVCVCVCVSVTKRHKAHLKRLDRRWTLGGVISRQQSRGELRNMLHRLPPSFPPFSFCYCCPHPISFIVSYHMTQLLSHAHICSGLHSALSSSKCSYHEPQSTTNH